MERKSNRLKHYDYSRDGYYFLTICTINRENLLCDIVWENDGNAIKHNNHFFETEKFSVPRMMLTNVGKTAEKYILSSNNMEDIFVDQYVIMPNHIHIIAKVVQKESKESTIEKKQGTSRTPSPTENCDIPNFDFARNTAAKKGTSRAPSPTVNCVIPRFVSTFKRFVNRDCRMQVFQRSYYDHIIRDESDYLRICEYIEMNPFQRCEDLYYH